MLCCGCEQAWAKGGFINWDLLSLSSWEEEQEAAGCWHWSCWPTEAGLVRNGQEALKA